MVNKRGQEMTLGTIVAMVLGVAVLVLLIWGFNQGWTNMWDRVSSFGGSSNVDSVVKACALRCSSGDKYGFCNELQSVKINGKDTVKASCYDLWENKTDNGFGIGECENVICS